MSRAGVINELADAISTRTPQRWLRVVVDGAPPTRPDKLADQLVDPIRLRGRPVLRVHADDFLRPASLRLEFGRSDPDAFYTDWLDLSALRREVLDPLEPHGTGRVLPSRWDAKRDRSTRAAYQHMPAGGVLLMDGGLLLGRGLPIDFAVHLWLSPAALARQITPDQQWTLPAYARYPAQAEPTEAADVVVRMDHPEHPAIVTAY